MEAICRCFPHFVQHQVYLRSFKEHFRPPPTPPFLYLQLNVVAGVWRGGWLPGAGPENKVNIRNKQGAINCRTGA